LRQFHLKLAFAAPRVFRKNVQNQLGTINHAPFRDFFDIALLHRRKFAIENNQWRLPGSGLRANFIQLAAPDQRCRVSNVSQLKKGSCNFRASASSQFDKLGKRFPPLPSDGHPGESWRAFPAHAYKQNAL
jgi:hypothetical protein